MKLEYFIKIGKLFYNIEFLTKDLNEATVFDSEGEALSHAKNNIIGYVEIVKYYYFN